MKIKIENYSMQPSRFIAGTKGSYGFDHIDVEFGEGWEGLSKKIIFCPPEGTPVSVVWAGQPIPIPVEVMSVRGKTAFAVVGYENEKTRITVTGELDVLNTLDADAAESAPPTESQMAQVMTYMQRAVSAAETVKNDAENGVFDGRGWHMGTALCGKGEGLYAQVARANAGDLYLNTDTYETYICTAKNTWSYHGTLKGTGVAAGWGTPTAEIHMLDADSAPTVAISASGEDTAKVLSFSFGIPTSYSQGGEVAGPKKYSVRFPNGGNEGVREDNAVGMVAEVAVGDAVVRNDFDAVSFYNRRICNGQWNEALGKWEIFAYLGDSEFKWDSATYEVLYECTPFYISDDTDIGNYVSVCGVPCDGYSLAPMFKNGYDKVYLPCFETFFVQQSDGSYKPRSAAHEVPTTVSFKGLCTRLNGYSEKAISEPIEVFYSELVLQLVEFATKDLGSVMKGVCELTYDNINDTVIARKDNYNFTVSANTAAKLVVGQTFAICADTLQKTVTDSNVIIEGIAYNSAGTQATVTVSKTLSSDIAGKYINSRLFRTGVAALAVTNASSGSATSNTSGKSPCIWRGKENPWGNGRNIISNVCSIRLTVDDEECNKASYCYDAELVRTGKAYSKGKKANYKLPSASGRITAFSTDRIYKCMTLPSQASQNVAGAPYFIGGRVFDGFINVGGGFRDGNNCGLCIDTTVLADIKYHDACIRYYMIQG